MWSLSRCSQKQLATNYNERGFNYYLRVEFNKAADDYSRSIELAESANSGDTKTLAAAYYNRGTIKYRMSMSLNVSLNVFVFEYIFDSASCLSSFLSRLHIYLSI